MTKIELKKLVYGMHYRLTLEETPDARVSWPFRAPHILPWLELAKSPDTPVEFLDIPENGATREQAQTIQKWFQNHTYRVRNEYWSLAIFNDSESELGQLAHLFESMYESNSLITLTWAHAPHHITHNQIVRTPRYTPWTHQIVFNRRPSEAVINHILNNQSQFYLTPNWDRLLFSNRPTSWFKKGLYTRQLSSVTLFQLMDPGSIRTVNQVIIRGKPQCQESKS